MVRILRFITLTFLFLLISLFIPHQTYASAPYNASDVLGQNSFYTDFENGPPGATGFSSPWDVAIDSDHHRLFVADAYANRVLVFNLDSNNTLVDRDADYVLGQSEMGPSDYDANAKGFRDPRSVEYDSTSNLLFVADTDNARVLVFDVSTITNNQDAIYVFGQPDFTTVATSGCWNTPPTSQTGFCNPHALAIDTNQHRLFVGDWSNNRVIVHQLDSTNHPIDNTADYVLGQPDFTTASYDTNAKGFNGLAGLVLDQSTNYLYVSDSNNARVLVFDVSSISNNEDAIYVLGQPDFTTDSLDINAKGFEGTQGLALDPVRHYLFVADARNNDGNRILVFDISSLSNNQDAIYVLGQPDFTSSGIDTDAKGFYGPGGIEYDPITKYLYTTEYNGNRVLIFDTTSIVNYEDAIDLLGQTDIDGNPDYTKNQGFNRNTTPNNRGLYGAYTTAFDTVHHRLFASDRWNYRVLVFNLNDSNELIDKVADYVIGQSDFTAHDVGNPASSTQTDYLFGLAYDSVNNRLFVADKDNNRVLVYDVSSNNMANGMAASYVIGQQDLDSAECNQGNVNPTAQTLCKPFNLALDSEQQVLYVVDQNNSRVLAYDVSSQSFSNNISAFRVFGQANFTGKQCNRGDIAAANTLCLSRGVAVNTLTHQLFVSDAKGNTNNRVLVFDVSPGITENGPDALYVLGQPDFITTNSGATANSFDNPNGVAVDAELQKLYVDDEYNYRVLVFDIASITNGEDAVIVLGQPDFITEDTHLVNQFSMNYATGVAINPSTHELFVGDGYQNDRFLIFTFAHLVDLDDSSPSVGTSVSQTLGSGYQGTTTYTLDSGTLPPGVSFNTSTGLLSGSYTTAGTYTFTISISDDNGNAGTYTDTKTYTVVVGGSSSTTSSPKPEGEYSTTEAPVCNTPKPDSIPSLF